MTHDLSPLWQTIERQLSAGNAEALKLIYELFDNQVEFLGELENKQ